MSDTSSVECEFCHNKFKNKHILKNHQLKTKYCLELQNESYSQKEKCQYCTKEFIHKHRKDYHEQTCDKKADYTITEQKENYENKLKDLRENYENKLKEQKELFQLEIKKKDEQILKELKDNNERLLKENKENTTYTTELLNNLVNKQTDLLAQKTTSINNNIKTTNNTITQKNNYINSMGVLNLTEEKIADALSGFSYIEFKNGDRKSLAEYLTRTLLTDENNKVMYPCVDISRRKFVYKNEEGKIIDDKNAQHLIKQINVKVQPTIRRHIKAMTTEVAINTDDEEVLDKGFDKINKLKSEYNIKSSGFIDALAVENDIKKYYSH